MAKLKEAGIKVLPVVPSVGLAKRMERAGADALMLKVENQVDMLVK